mmetsp:Transcript_8761/g.12973  ORF Transcript_8761/g.12973 Transcript_8761/m.12973 type:complete len:218 (+) Transcript_8761:60-713(+)
MKTAFLIAMIACIIAYASAKKICFDKEFETRVVAFDPAREFDGFHHTYFSVKENKHRIDIHEFEPEPRRLSIYFRHDLQKMYFYDRHEEKCESQPLHGSLEPHCLASNATMDGQIRFGHHLNSDVYTDYTEHGFRIRLVLSQVDNTPINLFVRGGHGHGAFLEEFFDWVHTVKDYSVFELPEKCQHLTAEATPSTISAKYQPYLKQAQKIAATYSKH